ncbi:MAG: hypothetical protein ACRCWL_10170, partial [Aeromonas sp.]
MKYQHYKELRCYMQSCMARLAASSKKGNPCAGVTCLKAAATFFGRLPHLSDGALRAVLRFLLSDNPLDPATFQRLELWPKLASLQDRRYVEPDVLFHFDDALV